ncbi:hypothetical protein [Hyphomicrobium sulfonivorans]|uniref:hypothetical protein n=1 Tax=Hyphomicrobium sulfonivorans TaxID=121290 RepID=UPI00156E5A64|nr:hypothetical protein [Hyphomicrobium sulfonivorans]MBI1650014.1 hypothetical protein [Hyphomicrobium sulfonivorans]
MAFVTGDVVAVDDEELPFKVVFKQGDTILIEWLVESQEEGEMQIVETLRSIIDEDDDEEEEEDDDDEEEDAEEDVDDDSDED